MLIITHITYACVTVRVLRSTVGKSGTTGGTTHARIHGSRSTPALAFRKRLMPVSRHKSQYELLSRNCNHFCQELCLRLGVEVSIRISQIPRLFDHTKLTLSLKLEGAPPLGEPVRKQRGRHRYRGDLREGPDTQGDGGNYKRRDRGVGGAGGDCGVVAARIAGDRRWGERGGERARPQRRGRACRVTGTRRVHGERLHGTRSSTNLEFKSRKGAM